jgi:hypothetical protein
MDLMVDIETLGKYNTSIVLTIGAQLFDSEQEGWITEPQWDMVTQSHYLPYMNARLDVDEQEAQGRTTCEETMRWWGNQTPEAQEEAFSLENRVPVRDALLQLSVMARSCRRVWAKGIAFDYTMLEHLYEMYKLPIPWKFWDVMDARTVYRLVPKEALGDKTVNGHIALDDCRNQVVMLQKAFRHLNIGRIK